MVQSHELHRIKDVECVGGMLNRVMGAVQIQEKKEDDVESRSSLGIVDDERGRRMAAVGCWQEVVMSDTCTEYAQHVLRMYHMYCTTCTVHLEYLEYQNHFRKVGS